MLGLMLLTSKGAAGVTGSGFVALVATLTVAGRATGRRRTVPVIPVAVNGPTRAITSVAPGNRNVFTRRIEMTSGIVASANFTIGRPSRATPEVTRTRASIATGPVHSRTANAIAAVAKAMTSLVAGLRRR